VNELEALDMFAHTGSLQTKDFHPLVKSLEAWEVNPQRESELRRNLPGATIKITDSFQEVRNTTGRYDLVVLDPPACAYGDQRQYVEYFEILPAALGVLKDRATVIFNVIPGGVHEAPGGRYEFSADHLERRRAFYGTDRPERLTPEEMLPAHRALVETHGFTLDWHYAAPRIWNGRLWHVVLHLSRKG
jgi:hypothetical protein